MNTQSKVLEKLKKILNLAHGKGATQGEAEAAIARAKEIAMQHSIDLATVDLTQDERANPIDIGTDTSLKTRSRFQQPYHRYVFHVLRQVFGVEIIRHVSRTPGGVRLSRITLIGEVTDVAIAREVFPWLEALFPRILSKAVSSGRLTYSAADTNGCYLGIMEGILQSNARQEKNLDQAQAQTYALVVRKKEDLIDEVMKRLFPNLKEARSRSLKTNFQAYSHGYEKGRSIRLNQVGTSTSSQLQ